MRGNLYWIILLAPVERLMRNQVSFRFRTAKKSLLQLWRQQGKDMGTTPPPPPFLSLFSVSGPPSQEVRTFFFFFFFAFKICPPPPPIKNPGAATARKISI